MPVLGLHLKDVMYAAYLVVIISSLWTAHSFLNDSLIPLFCIFFLIRLLQYLGREKDSSTFQSLSDLRKSVHAGKETLQGFKDGYITARDGTRLYYQRCGYGPKIVFLANGLGAREWMWLNFMEKGSHLLSEVTFVSWDYRGMFASGAPPPGKLSVRDHTEDLLDLMNILGVERAHAVVGWSTGVQVALQFAAMYGERVDRLVLMNGAHGHTLHSALQPIVMVPLFAEALSLLCFGLRSFTNKWWSSIGKVIYKHERIFRYLSRPYAVLFGNSLLEWAPLIYFADVFAYQEGVSDSRHTHFTLQMFQELDAHSAFHLLPEIQTKTLIIGGFLDALTPVYHSFATHARMPDSRLFIKLFGTHFTLFEFPDEVSNVILNFLAEKAINKYLSPEELARADLSESVSTDSLMKLNFLRETREQEKQINFAPLHVMKDELNQLNEDNLHDIDSCINDNHNTVQRWCNRRALLNPAINRVSHSSVLGLVEAHDEEMFAENGYSSSNRLGSSSPPHEPNNSGDVSEMNRHSRGIQEKEKQSCFKLNRNSIFSNEEALNNDSKMKPFFNINKNPIQTSNSSSRRTRTVQLILSWGNRAFSSWWLNLLVFLSLFCASPVVLALLSLGKYLLSVSHRTTTSALLQLERERRRKARQRKKLHALIMNQRYEGARHQMAPTTPTIPSIRARQISSFSFQPIHPTTDQTATSSTGTLNDIHVSPSVSPDPYTCPQTLNSGSLKRSSNHAVLSPCPPAMEIPYVKRIGYYHGRILRTIHRFYIRNIRSHIHAGIRNMLEWYLRDGDSDEKSSSCDFDDDKEDLLYSDGDSDDFENNQLLKTEQLYQQHLEHNPKSKQTSDDSNVGTDFLSTESIKSLTSLSCPYRVGYSPRYASAFLFGARHVDRSGISGQAAGAVRLLRQHITHRMFRHAHKCRMGICDCVLAEEVCAEGGNSSASQVILGSKKKKKQKLKGNSWRSHINGCGQSSFSSSSDSSVPDCAGRINFETSNRVNGLVNGVSVKGVAKTNEQRRALKGRRLRHICRGLKTQGRKRYRCNASTLKNRDDNHPLLLSMQTRLLNQGNESLWVDHNYNHDIVDEGVSINNSSKPFSKASHYQNGNDIYLNNSFNSQFVVNYSPSNKSATSVGGVFSQKRANSRTDINSDVNHQQQRQISQQSINTAPFIICSINSSFDNNNTNNNFSCFHQRYASFSQQDEPFASTVSSVPPPPQHIPICSSHLTTIHDMSPVASLNSPHPEFDAIRSSEFFSSFNHPPATMCANNMDLSLTSRSRRLPSSRAHVSPSRPTANQSLLLFAAEDELCPDRPTISKTTSSHSTFIRYPPNIVSPSIPPGADAKPPANMIPSHVSTPCLPASHSHSHTPSRRNSQGFASLESYSLRPSIRRRKLITFALPNGYQASLMRRHTPPSSSSSEGSLRSSCSNSANCLGEFNETPLTITSPPRSKPSKILSPEDTVLDEQFADDNFCNQRDEDSIIFQLRDGDVERVEENQPGNIGINTNERRAIIIEGLISNSTTDSPSNWPSSHSNSVRKGQLDNQLQRHDLDSRQVKDKTPLTALLMTRQPSVISSEALPHSLCNADQNVISENVMKLPTNGGDSASHISMSIFEQNDG